MYVFTFIYTCCSILIRLLIAKKKAYKQVSGYLQQLQIQHKGIFDKKTFYKIAKSHSIYLIIINNAFTRLHGRDTNAKEQERSMRYFTCSSLFDNFWDDQSHTVEEIEAMSFKPETYVAKSFDEQVFVASHLFLKADMKRLDEYLQVFNKVVKAQQYSLQQINSTLSDEAVQNITFSKGGNSVLLCRYYLDIEPTKEEENCWYQVGVLIQFTNDLFDIYKDLQDNIATLPNRCIHAYQLEKLYLKQVQILQRNIQHLPYAKSKKQAFSIAMASTYCLGLLAIENLKKIQGNNAAMPLLTSVPRKKLIIDMEKFANLKRWTQLMYQYAKL
jgi:hypothetical protein